jgi:hypothetical protein
LYVDESREPDGLLRIASYSHILLPFSYARAESLRGV